MIARDNGHGTGDDFRHCEESGTCGTLPIAAGPPGTYHLWPLVTPLQTSMTTELARARENMIEQQIRPWEVLDPRVLAVFRQVERDRFVPAEYRNVAYSDVEIPIGHGERMMKPVVEARLLQALELTGSEQVLEIGTGSGFLTACLARLGAQVTSVERHQDLVEAARLRLAGAGIAGARIECADALAGWRPDQTFDAIAVTGAVDTVAAQLLDWLAEGGRMFVVHGRAPAMQAALVTRIDAGHVRTDSLFETELDYLHGAAPKPRFVL
jgi:protein-L-isoaspartate(D-aspartate) O-methyltransferase